MKKKNCILLLIASLVISGCGTTTAFVEAMPDGAPVRTLGTESEKVAHEHFKLGYKYRSQGQFKLSAEEFRKAYYSLTSSDPSYAKGSLANEYGYSLIKVKKYVEARKVIEKALEFNQLSNDKIGIAVSYLNLGDTYDRSGDHQSAIPYYKKALEMSEEVGVPDLRRTILNRMN